MSALHRVPGPNHTIPEKLKSKRNRGQNKTLYGEDHARDKAGAKKLRAQRQELTEQNESFTMHAQPDTLILSLLSS